eukprot:1535784-Rhodomonas_salina.1
MAKAIHHYRGDASRLTDLARETIVFETPADIAKCLRAMVDDHEIEIVRVRSTLVGAPPTPQTGKHAQPQSSRLGFSERTECDVVLGWPGPSRPGGVVGRVQGRLRQAPNRQRRLKEPRGLLARLRAHPHAQVHLSGRRTFPFLPSSPFFSRAPSTLTCSCVALRCGVSTPHLHPTPSSG